MVKFKLLPKPQKMSMLQTWIKLSLKPIWINNFQMEKKISMFMMNVKCLVHFVNDLTCKGKCGSMLGYFKKINS